MFVDIKYTEVDRILLKLLGIGTTTKKITLCIDHKYRYEIFCGLRAKILKILDDIRENPNNFSVKNENYKEWCSETENSKISM